MQITTFNKNDDGETIYDIDTRAPMILSVALLVAMFTESVFHFRGFFGFVWLSAEMLLMALIMFAWVYSTRVVPDDGVHPVVRFPRFVFAAKLMAGMAFINLGLGLLALIFS